MKNTILVFMTVVLSAIMNMAMAENNDQMMPPPGPYQSIDGIKSHGSKHICEHEKGAQSDSSVYLNQVNRDLPQWVKAQQVQRGQRMQQSNMPPQSWGNQSSPARNYNQAPQMLNSNRGPSPQSNRMQEYFPYARGPIYGPNMPPAEYNQQPRYPVPRFQNN